MTFKMCSALGNDLGGQARRCQQHARAPVESDLSKLYLLGKKI